MELGIKGLGKLRLCPQYVKHFIRKVTFLVICRK